MGLLEKKKINRVKKEKILKKKSNKLKQEGETDLDGTAVKKSIKKLKRKSETEDGVTAKKSVKKLKRKGETEDGVTAKKSVKKLKRKSAPEDGVTAKKSVKKLKKKNETAHGETTEESTNILKRKSEAVHDGTAEKAKKQRTKDEVSSDQNGKTDFINKSDGDSGKNAGDDKPFSEKERLLSHRLFVLTRGIITEERVKNLHPDVISVRFPRKKRSRWCWAIFDSEEIAGKVYEELKNLKDVIVRKPIHKSPVKKKRPPKSKMRKQIKTSLLQTWL